MFFSRYSSFIASKRRISEVSCLYALTTRTPDRFSCANVVSSPKYSWTASKRS